jgi:hypothetical protein
MHVPDVMESRGVGALSGTSKCRQHACQELCRSMFSNQRLMTMTSFEASA